MPANQSPELLLALGQAVRALRLARGITQEQLAEAAGLPCPMRTTTSRREPSLPEPEPGSKGRVHQLGRVSRGYAEPQSPLPESPRIRVAHQSSSCSMRTG